MESLAKNIEELGKQITHGSYFQTMQHISPAIISELMMPCPLADEIKEKSKEQIENLMVEEACRLFGLRYGDMNMAAWSVTKDGHYRLDLPALGLTCLYCRRRRRGDWEWYGFVNHAPSGTVSQVTPYQDPVIVFHLIVRQAIEPLAEFEDLAIGIDKYLIEPRFNFSDDETFELPGEAGTSEGKMGVESEVRRQAALSSEQEGASYSTKEDIDHEDHGLPTDIEEYHAIMRRQRFFPLCEHLPEEIREELKRTYSFALWKGCDHAEAEMREAVFYNSKWSKDHLERVMSNGMGYNVKVHKLVRAPHSTLH